MAENRDAGGGWTLVAAIVACATIGLRFNVWLGCAAFWMVFAVVGEIQRKANQIIDAIEKRGR